MIYMDHAATSIQKPDCVVKAVIQTLTTPMGNPDRGVNAASLQASRLVYQTRLQLANFFGAEGPDRIAFTMNSTESLNIAIQGLLSPGDHVITSCLEHNSVLRPLYMMQKKGIDLTIIGCDDAGDPLYDQIESAIQNNTRAIIMTHASNLTGNLVDINYIGYIARQHHLIFILDASQTAGIYPIHVQNMGIDILCFTGHKSLLGPQGTGGIYVRPGISLRPLLSGGSGILTYQKEHPSDMPTALEAGTLNTHGLAGLQAALQYIEETGMHQIRAKELELMWAFYHGIVNLPGVTVYGNFSDKDRCPIVTLNILDYDSSKVSDLLYTKYDICVRSGAHCAPLMHKALGTVDQGAVRFSFSHYNTMEEVNAAITAVSAMVSSVMVSDTTDSGV